MTFAITIHKEYNNCIVQPGMLIVCSIKVYICGDFLEFFSLIFCSMEILVTFEASY